MGYFSIAMACLVGEEGKVISVDLQKRMLFELMKRAQKCGVSSRVQTVEAKEHDLNIKIQADFALAFWMIHEVPDRNEYYPRFMIHLKIADHF